MQLTKSNADIIRLLADGKGDKEIARELSLQPGTVTQRISRMCRKFQCGNRTQLALKWVMFNLGNFAQKA